MRKQLWGILKRSSAFLGGGIVDSLISRITKREIQFGKFVAAKLTECEPWSDHYEHNTLVELRTACREGDYTFARTLMKFGAKKSATEHCLRLAELAIDMLSEGSEPEVEYVFDFLEN